MSATTYQRSSSHPHRTFQMFGKHDIYRLQILLDSRVICPPSGFIYQLMFSTWCCSLLQSFIDSPLFSVRSTNKPITALSLMSQAEMCQGWGDAEWYGSCRTRMFQSVDLCFCNTTDKYHYKTMKTCSFHLSDIYSLQSFRVEGGSEPILNTCMKEWVIHMAISNVSWILNKISRYEKEMNESMKKPKWLLVSFKFLRGDLCRPLD